MGKWDSVYLDKANWAAVILPGSSQYPTTSHCWRPFSVLYSLDMYKLYTSTGYIMNIIHEYWYEYLWTCVSIYIWYIYIHEYVYPPEGTYPTITSIDLLGIWPDLLQNQPLASYPKKMKVIQDFHRLYGWKFNRKHQTNKIQQTTILLEKLRSPTLRTKKKTGWYAYNWQMSRAQIGYLDLLMCRFGQSIYSPLRF